MARIAVVGAGAMGHGVARLCAPAGHPDPGEGIGPPAETLLHEEVEVRGTHQAGATAAPAAVAERVARGGLGARSGRGFFSRDAASAAERARQRDRLLIRMPRARP